MYTGEGCKQLALLLVEIISPDIMYNGLPWPEDEFMKVRLLATYILRSQSDPQCTFTDSH